MIQGNNWANLFEGKSSIEAMNVMNFDAMVVGNHEFDFGQEVLKERIGEANFSCPGSKCYRIERVKAIYNEECGWSFRSTHRGCD